MVMTKMTIRRIWMVSLIGITGENLCDDVDDNDDDTDDDVVNDDDDVNDDDNVGGRCL